MPVNINYFTFAGGLASVIYTDTLQTVILVGGASTVFVMGKLNFHSTNI